MKAIFGSMNFGQQIFGRDALDMLLRYRELGGKEIDTAYVYNDGACERLLGECFRQIGTDDLLIATKVNPRVTGRLDFDAVISQLEESLERMGLESVDLLYLHFPDPIIPVEEPIRACAELYDAGKVREIGLSNFSLDDINRVRIACDELGCPRPTVYEGVYNALSRNVEEDLLPALHDWGMRFYAYNPLAGGLLTGKYRDLGEQPTGGRFSLRPGYRDRYWKESYFEAVGKMADACAKYNIPLVEASLRWLSYHSSLDDGRGDGVIVGSSCLLQLDQNMASLQKGELPVEVLDVFEAGWAATREDAPEYHRFTQKK